jgi:hypothetical protein
MRWRIGKESLARFFARNAVLRGFQRPGFAIRGKSAQSVGFAPDAPLRA